MYKRQFYDCTLEWYPYDEGLGMSQVDPYVGPNDYWVDVRVRQYTANQQSLLGSGWQRIMGGNRCTSDCGVVVPPAGARSASTTAATAGSTDDRRAPSDTTPATGRPAPASETGLNARRTWGARGQPRAFLQPSRATRPEVAP